MAGIFDLTKGAFDSSEASRLHEAYAMALQGLSATHGGDASLAARLSRSIVKVARSEPDCLRNDGTIDPVRLAQRAVLRMLQTSAPKAEEPAPKPSLRDRLRKETAKPPEAAAAKAAPKAAPESPSKVMLKIFDGTRFAKL